MPAFFDQPGLRFAYPDNWRIEPAEETGPITSVTVLAPGTAYWTVSRYPVQAGPNNLVEEAVAALREEYRELEIEEIHGPYARREMAGCDMAFHFLDLTSTASVRWFREPGGLYLLVWQAEDREYDALAPVFEAMAVSLLQNLGREVP
jgi:hypothetical protein